MLYKAATSLLQNAAVLKILKINPNQLKYPFAKCMNNLNEYAFKSVTAVSVGLVLSCFGKAGADYAATAIDQLCFVSGD